jgi:hypothetical protein
MPEVLDALGWVRTEIMRLHAPDQMRQRLREARVRALCADLIRGAYRPGTQRPQKPRGH